MAKKGQITLFLIIGIILVFMVIFVFVFAKTLREAQIGQSYKRLILSGEEIGQAKGYLDSCLKERAGTLLKLLGLQGGILPGEEYRNPFITRGAFLVPYYLKDKAAYIPNPSFLQNQLTSLLRTEFQGCVENNVLQEVGVTIVLTGNVSSDVLINKDNVAFHVNASILVSKGNFQSTLEEFYYRAPIKLGYLIDKARLLVTLIKNANTDPENPGAFDISQKDAPIIDFSPALVKACHIQDGADRFIRLEQYGDQGEKMFTLLFVIDGMVVGDCTKDPFAPS